MLNNYLTKVRHQYENYPFPLRNPEDEKKRLVVKIADILERINHYGFGGRETFKNNFRILVAGGGTGDSTIFLAEQLKNTNASIVHLDMSDHSIKIAKERASIRGLKNITWIHDSILNIPQRNLGSFDYINCTGVLHHMEKPEEGLGALKSVLSDRGLLCLMVYGTYGRTGVYQTQKLMQLIQQQEENDEIKVKQARQIIESLPETHWLIRGNKKEALQEVLCDDSNIYDTFLHSCDRSYTVPELYDFVKTAELQIVSFTGFNRDAVNAKQLYTPRFYLKNNPEILQKIEKLPLRDQQSIAELISGSRSLHTVYLNSQKFSQATPDQLDLIPFFFMHPKEIHLQISQTLTTTPHSTLHLVHQFRTSTLLTPQKYTGVIFKYLDGKRTLGEIFECVRKEQQKPISDQELLTDFKPVYESLFEIDLMLLRASNVEWFAESMGCINTVSPVEK